jgi:hypothetical protein
MPALLSVRFPLCTKWYIAMTLGLETGDRQLKAAGLYAGAGYRRIPNFGAYAGAVHSLCFERRPR